MAGEANGLPPLRLLLFGPPGCGKGTQAALLAQRLGVPAISTGEMLRQAVTAGNALGKRVDAIIRAGKLVDDVTMAAVVRERLTRDDARRGFLLDGYPRNGEQAAMLEEILHEQGKDVDAAIFLEVPSEELVRRMSGRREEAGRADDQDSVVRERLRIYEEKTAPLVDYYEKRGLLRHIDGNRPVDSVATSIISALRRSAA